MRIYPTEALFYPAILNGKQVYICEDRLHTESLTDWFYYEARHDDNGDWVTPVSIEQRVVVNFCCSVLSKEALLSDGETYLDASGLDIDYNTTLHYIDLISGNDKSVDLCTNCWNEDCKALNSNTIEKQNTCRFMVESEKAEKESDCDSSFVEPDWWDDRTCPT